MKSMTESCLAESWSGAQAMAMKNAAKVHSKWRDLLRQAKKAELQKQVQHVAEAHEHAMQSRGKLMEVCPSRSACWSACVCWQDALNQAGSVFAAALPAGRGSQIFARQLRTC